MSTLLLSSLLSSCAAPVLDLDGIRNKTLESRKQAAQQHASHQELIDALEQWEIVALLAPGDRSVTQKIRKLRIKIDALAEQYQAEGERQMRLGHFKAARNMFLRTLSLHPNDELSLKYLREIEQSRMEHIMATKVADKRTTYDRLSIKNQVQQKKEAFSYSWQAVEQTLASDDPDATLAELKRHEREFPDDIKARERLALLVLREAESDFSEQRYQLTLTRLSKAARLAQGNPELKEKIAGKRLAFANRLYSAGILAHRRDPTQAIELWRYAVRYNPKHAKAALRLKRSASVQAFP